MADWELVNHLRRKYSSRFVYPLEDLTEADSGKWVIVLRHDFTVEVSVFAEDICGLDSIYKLKLGPTIRPGAWLPKTDMNFGCALVYILASKPDQESLQTGLNAFVTWLRQERGPDVPWNPTFMIDHDVTEMAALRDLNFFFTYCLFHVRKDVGDMIRRLFPDEEHRRLWNEFYLSFERCQSDMEFEKLWSQLDAFKMPGLPKEAHRRMKAYFLEDVVEDSRHPIRPGPTKAVCTGTNSRTPTISLKPNLGY